MIYFFHFGSTCKRVQYYDMIFKAEQETAANPSAASSADFENKEVISSSRRHSDASQILCGFFRVVHTHASQTGQRIRGAPVRPFPSTISAVTAKTEGGRLMTKHIWAGDSRT